MDETMTDDRAAGDMQYAVVGCQCGNVWSLELRHSTSTCTGCRSTVDVARRRRLWQGNDLREAQAQAAAHRTAKQLGHAESETAAALQSLEPQRRLAQHDSPVDAAAAKARRIANKSARADAVALWLTRLEGDFTEESWLTAMKKAGVAGERAEKELVRMLACDVVYEPLVGRYAALET